MVVLTGEGAGFCSGLDLTEGHFSMPGTEDMTEVPRQMYLQVAIVSLLEKIHHSPKPFIAAVNGPAVGGGFALGIGLRSKESGECILLTEHRQALVPILVYCEGELDLLPDMPAAEKCRRQATAHAEIAQAVAAARAICNPYRAAEARRQPVKRRRANSTRQ